MHCKPISQYAKLESIQKRAFLLLIDDLQVDYLVDKYVDDTTLTELLHGRNESYNMQDFFQQLLNWSNINDMAVNFTKTTKQEMVMGPVALSSNLPLIQWTEGQIERVSSFKVLGLHLDADFSWQPGSLQVGDGEEWYHRGESDF